MSGKFTRSMVILAGLASVTSYGMPTASAAGCLKGAAVGGVAGHVAGHGVLGAAAGCAVGHHEAGKKAKAAQQNANQPVQNGANNPDRGTTDNR